MYYYLYSLTLNYLLMLHKDQLPKRIKGKVESVCVCVCVCVHTEIQSVFSVKLYVYQKQF